MKTQKKQIQLIRKEKKYTANVEWINWLLQP